MSVPPQSGGDEAVQEPQPAAEHGEALQDGALSAFLQDGRLHVWRKVHVRPREGRAETQDRKSREHFCLIINVTNWKKEEFNSFSKYSIYIV